MVTVCWAVIGTVVLVAWLALGVALLMDRGGEP
jgi:hypothetical protein